MVNQNRVIALQRFPKSNPYAWAVTSMRDEEVHDLARETNPDHASESWTRWSQHHWRFMFPIFDHSNADVPLEAPNMFRSVDGLYFLLFSSGCKRTVCYNLNYATTPPITGLYKKADSPLLITDDTSVRYQGPGSGDAGYGGKLLFHAWYNVPDRDSVRGTYVADIVIDGTRPTLKKIYYT